MKIYLLDAGGAGLIFGFLIIFMLIAILIEAATMAVMKYNKFGKALLDSLIANIVSLCLGFIFIQFFDSLDITDNYLLNMLILFLSTVAIEFAALYLLNQSKPAIKTLTACFIMNIFTYAILYFLRIG